MMKQVLLAAVVAGLSVQMSSFAAVPAVAVKDVITPPFRSFAPGEVILLQGPFKAAEDAQTTYLMSLEPDRLLSGFRSVAGLEPKAKKYGGWEERGVAGHSLGHWMSGLAYVYAMHHDAQVLEKLNYVVDELAEVQKTTGGWLMAFEEGPRIFKEIREGDIRTQNFDLNGGWVPWYTFHKQMSGLRDIYLLTGNTKALDVLKRKADWAIDATSHLNAEQWQKMLACEHGGMNEILADLYAITGDTRYKDLALKFHHNYVLDPLTNGVNNLPGLHGNTQIPKLIGLARLHELTGEPKYRKAAGFFWNTVIDTQSYANGGNTSNEYFGPPNEQGKRIDGNTSETCNTYNLLKLAAHLYNWETDEGQRSKLAEWAERATLNHILASTNPANGATLYYVRLGAASHKDWSTSHDSFWCCVGTGMENHSRYPHWIYSKGDNVLAVNQFIASEVTWSEQGVKVRQETRFPQEPKTRFVIDTQGETKSFTLQLRYPAWAIGEARVSINGQPESIQAKPGSFINLKREWKDGDTVEFDLPMALHDEPLPGLSGRHAIFYGPVLLSGNVDRDKAKNPVILADNRPIDEWLKPTDEELMFATENVGKPEDVTLRPFYEVTSGHYNVYWDYFTPQQWADREAAYRAEQERIKALEARTLDTFTPGEQQPEVDRGLAQERSRAGEHWGRKWRDAFDGGYFEFSLKVDPAVRNQLILTYYGSDGGGREFDILIDGVKVGTEKLERNKPDQFFDVVYPLTPEMVNDKTSVRVRLQAHPGKIAGGMFGVRMVKAE